MACRWSEERLPGCPGGCTGGRGLVPLVCSPGCTPAVFDHGPSPVEELRDAFGVARDGVPCRTCSSPVRADMRSDFGSWERLVRFYEAERDKPRALRVG